MLSNSRRHILVIGLLLLAIGLTWGQRWAQASKIAGDLEPRVSATLLESDGRNSDSPDVPETYFTYFVDVDGWYRITPHETVVRSRYEMIGVSSEAMAEALPTNIGPWQQVGGDQFIADDPGVVKYLNEPTVALQRIYRDASDQYLILSVLGNTGDDSFLLFSHTPETCLPGRLWAVVDNRRVSALLDDRPMSANYVLTEHTETGERQVVLYWYLWTSPQRDAGGGILSMRIYLPVPADQSEADVLARAWEFIRELFPATLPWDRF